MLLSELMGLIPGMALGLTVNDVDGAPWDFNVEEKRNKAKQMVYEKRALLLIGGPMCSAFSQLQSINFSRMNNEDVDKIIEYGARHLDLLRRIV